MRALILTPRKNRPGKSDYTGAFLPEAKAFAALHKIAPERIVDVDATAPNSACRAHVEAALQSNGPLSLVAFFCHGLRTGLQLGHSIQTVDALAKAIAKNGSESIVVALYACSTGGGPAPGGEGGFADRLRDALCRAGKSHCSVVAHDNAGHATRNPRVRRFEGRGSPVGGMGGTWLVAPGSELWKPWVRALQKTDLRLRFPLMDPAQIHRELLGAQELVA